MYGETLSNKVKNSNGDGGFDFLRLLKKESTKPDSVASTGPYLAQVLRVRVVTAEEDETTMGAELKNNFTFKSKFSKVAPPNPFAKKRWIIIHGRITNEYISQAPIHNYLPPPAQIGSLEDIGDDFRSDNIIRAHSEFISQTPDTEVPVVGTFIWVDYLDKRGGKLKHPIYLKPLFPSATVGIPSVNKDCPKAVHNKVPPTGGKIKTTPSSPSTLKRSPGTSSKSLSKFYKLHGYTWENFTNEKRKWQKERFSPPTEEELSAAPEIPAAGAALAVTKPYHDNLEGLVAAAEVIHMYFKSTSSPKDKIEVYHASAATRRKSTGSKHNFGIAMDVAVKINGKRLAIWRVWAALIKLAAAEKLPDGAIGYYQQSKNNKIITKGTNIKPYRDGNNNPHYDFRTEDHTGPNDRRKRIRWNWTSTVGSGGKSTVTETYKSFSAKKILKWKGAVKNLYPAHCKQALSDYSPETGTPEPPNTLPTWRQVKDLRKALLAGKQPVANAVVAPGPSPVVEIATRPTPPVTSTPAPPKAPKGEVST